MLPSFDHGRQCPPAGETLYDRISHTELARVLAISPLYMEFLWHSGLYEKREERCSYTEVQRIAWTPTL